MKNQMLYLLILVIAIFQGCKKDKEIKPDVWSLKESVKGYSKELLGDTIVLNGNAIMIGDDINDNLREVGEDRLTFKNDSALDIMLAGDVIYSLPTEKYPDGYAFIVTSKEVAGSQVICTYEQASMEDVFAKLNQKVDLKPDMSEAGIKVYEVMETGYLGGRMSNTGMSKILGFNSDRFKSVKFTDNSASLTYVLYDIDGDYKKTDYDQITAEVKLSADFSNIGNISLSGLYFQFSGEPVVGTSVEFQIGKAKGDPKINNALAGKMKKELVGKRIPLLSFNVAQLSGVGRAVNLVVAPTVDIFMTLEVDAEGNLTAKLSYENTKLYFEVLHSPVPLVPNRYHFKVQEWGKPDFGIEAKLEGEAKLGLGTGLTFRFPTFKYEKNKNSYVGLYTDLSYRGTVTAHGDWSVSEGAQCKNFGFSLRPHWQTQIDGKLGIFQAGLLDIKVQPEMFDVEVGFLRKLEKSFNYCEVAGEESDEDELYNASEFSNPYLNQSLKYGKMADIDGNVYPTIKIGTQIWMAENLKVTRYNDGVVIPNVANNNIWAGSTTGAWCYYTNNSGYNSIYGKLYNWYTVNTGKLCPKGWHIPTDLEWTSLVDYLGNDPGGKMKSIGDIDIGTGVWRYPNIGATNESGFSGIPCGPRGYDGAFNNIVDAVYWWSSTQSNTNSAWRRDILYMNTMVNKNISSKKVGFPCRCIKD